MVHNIQSDLPLKLFQENQPQKSEDSKDFADTLKEAILDENQLQNEAHEATLGFIRGDITDLHQVMAIGERAKIGMELIMEIRNKMVEAYQEIMRMQI